MLFFETAGKLEHEIGSVHFCYLTPEAFLYTTALILRYQFQVKFNYLCFFSPHTRDRSNNAHTIIGELNYNFTFPTVIYNRGKVLESAQEISKISRCFVLWEP